MSFPYRVLSLSALAFVVLLAGCGGASNAPSSSTPVTPPSGNTKASIQGLVAMGNEDFVDDPDKTPVNDLADPLANPDVYSGAVILVTWKQLQPDSESAIDTSVIDDALNTIATYNSTHSKQMVGKLRVFAGVNSPAWAMNLDGAPITVTENGTVYMLPRYWTANYIAAWTNLQQLLAAKYDTDPRMQEVAVSGCSSTTAEPFIHVESGSAISPLQSAGYTDTQYKTCLSTMTNQYAAWKDTALDYTFNGFGGIDTGKVVVDTNFTISVMAAWRSALGTRGVIANHGLQPVLTSDAVAIYPEFVTLGPPIEFQTYGPTVNWDQSVAVAVQYKCSELEIWPTTASGGQAAITLNQLQTYAGEI